MSFPLNPLSVSGINLTPGYSWASEREFRSWARRRVGNDRIVWEVRNRITDVVELLIGPCTLDEMIATMRKLDAPVAFEKKVVWR